jgi:hypothetical protein
MEPSQIQPSKFTDLKLSCSNLDKNTFQLLLKSLEEGLVNVTSVRIGLPPSPIKLINELDGNIYIVTMNGDVSGCIRTHSDISARNIAIEKFKIPKSANPFAMASFNTPGLELSRKGEVLVTRGLEVEEMTLEVVEKYQLEIHVRI